MITKPTRILIVVALLAVGAYWYWSPYWALHNMKTAAENKDAETVNELVDYPRLRESLKGQFMVAMSAGLAKSAQGADGLESAGVALGTMLGGAMVDGLVDAMVRPEFVMQAMQDAEVSMNEETAPAGDVEADGSDELEWTSERRGFDKLIVHGSRPSDSAKIGAVFERSGFATWKLTEIRLPKMPNIE